MDERLEQNLLLVPDFLKVKDLETRIDHRLNVTLQYAHKPQHNYFIKTGGVSPILLTTYVFSWRINYWLDWWSPSLGLQGEPSLCQND